MLSVNLRHECDGRPGRSSGAIKRSEYEALINAADFISILKLKAREQLNAIQ
jgi:hypothetical protein